MTDYLLDTNHASKLMAQEEPIVSRVRQAQVGGDRFGLSVTVPGELYYAVYASQRRQENLRRLQGLLNALILWPFNELAAEALEPFRPNRKQKAALFHPWMPKLPPLPGSML
jgi:predicted nucleic acid-binding protein